jgi:hypothetical protein
VKLEDSGAVLTNASDIEPGKGIRAQLSRGEIIATVNKVLTDD